MLFLGQHDLISAEDARQRDSYATKAAASRQSLWTRVLHQYLFFRIPLWRPDAFLNRAWPVLERHGGWMVRVALPLLLALGVFLVARDWSRFIATFPHLFSLGGILAFGVAPFVAMMATSYTKLVIVFGLLRTALGLQQTPPNMVLNGIAIVLSIYIMAPVGMDIGDALINAVRDARRSRENLVYTVFAMLHHRGVSL